MVKAKSANTTKVNYRGKIYHKYLDAYPTKGGAYSRAKGLRTVQGRIEAHYMTRAIVVDLGKDAGRLRYGVFVAGGPRVK